MRSEEIDSEVPPDLDAVRSPPKAAEFLARPWYARLWWGCIAGYWTGKLASLWSPPLDALYSMAISGVLNVVFYPLTIVIVLGVGFVRAWMSYKGLEWRPPTQDQLFPKRSVGGWRDPSTDPLDPRSGQLWINAPRNRSK